MYLVGQYIEVFGKRTYADNCYHSGLIRESKSFYIQIISTLLDLIEHTLARW
jgi:hypothetical protein